MPDSLAAMKVALRVLAALSEKLPPPSADIEELRRIAPGGDDVPLDDLACEVIQRAVRARAAARRQSQS
jgi:hypothetical protein